MSPFESKAPHGLASHEALVASILWLTLAAPPASAMAPGVDPANAASPSESSDLVDVPLRIEIDSPMAIEGADLLRTRIAERSRETGSARIPAIEGHDPWIAVKLSGVKFAYFVSVTAMRGGRLVGPAVEPVECRCSSEELLAFIDTRISAAADVLRGPAAGPGDPGSPSPTPAQDLTEDTGPVRPSKPGSSDVGPEVPQRRAMGPLGYSGIGLGIVGTATLGAGVALMLRPDEVRGPQGTAWRETLRPPAIAMTVGGGVALATGVVLIAVDLVRRRDRSLSLAPTFTRREAGLVITRRF
jgi:hypothetical protein